MAKFRQTRSFASRLRRFLREADLSYNGMEQISGVSHEAIRLICEMPQWQWREKTQRKLEAAMHVVENTTVRDAPSWVPEKTAALTPVLKVRVRDFKGLPSEMSDRDLEDAVMYWSAMGYESTVNHLRIEQKLRREQQRSLGPPFAIARQIVKVRIERIHDEDEERKRNEDRLICARAKEGFYPMPGYEHEQGKFPWMSTILFYIACFMFGSLLAYGFSYALNHFTPRYECAAEWGNGSSLLGTGWLQQSVEVRCKCHALFCRL